MQNVELQVIGLLIFALVVSTSAYLIWKRRKKQRTISLTQINQIGRQKKRYRFLKLDHSLPPFNTKSSSFEAQSELWKQQMAEIGKKYKANKLSHIYFIHGTFVGDSFDVLPTIENFS